MKKITLQSVKEIFNLSYVAVIVLFCLAVSTSYMSLDYTARYISTNSSSDGARVAVFDVSSDFTGATENITLSYNSVSAEYPFNVTSESEVSVEYDVVLTLPDNMADNDVFEFTLANKDNDIKTPTRVGNVYTFENVDTFSAGNGTHNLKLKITALSVQYEYIGVNIKAEVVARQID